MPSRIVPCASSLSPTKSNRFYHVVAAWRTSVALRPPQYFVIQMFVTGKRPMATSATMTATHAEQPIPVGAGPIPGLVLAWGPTDLLAHDRAPLTGPLVVGRSSSCEWCLRDHMLSRTHFRIAPGETNRFVLRDLGSRNGVSVDGERVTGQVILRGGEVVRAGGCVFIVVDDMTVLSPPDASRDDSTLAGRFYSWGILRKLRIAARSGQSVLLEGETGVGKELAAIELHRFYGELGREGELQQHNAACFAGEDDAVGALFGVTPGAFTGVESRIGALEAAHSGTLFLDELHALPLRVQRSLLRFVEDGLLQPLGQSTPSTKKTIDSRLIFGTNIDVDEACEKNLLGHDLVARLYRVKVPPLRERRADIPSIFVAVVLKTLSDDVAERVMKGLRANVVERLCLYGYEKGNVRELVQMASIIGARIAEGDDLKDAIYGTIQDAIGKTEDLVCTSADLSSATSSGSVYEQRKQEILEAYHEVGGNLSRMEALLRERGIPCTRRWLAVFLDRWGVRPIPKRN